MTKALLKVRTLMTHEAVKRQNVPVIKHYAVEKD